MHPTKYPTAYAITILIVAINNLPINIVKLAEFSFAIAKPTIKYASMIGNGVKLSNTDTVVISSNIYYFMPVDFAVKFIGIIIVVLVITNTDITIMKLTNPNLNSGICNNRKIKYVINSIINLSMYTGTTDSPIVFFPLFLRASMFKTNPLTKNKMIIALEDNIDNSLIF